MLTQKRLKELLTYNPETGVFTRNCTTSPRAQAGQTVGSKHNAGYLCVSIDRKSHLLHRLAWLYMYGFLPEHDIDHINHDRTDNRIRNLRSVTRSENLRNQSVCPRNTSGIMGVSFDSERNKWMVRIKKKHLGRYSDYFEAICVRKSAESRYGFHPNHGL